MSDAATIGQLIGSLGPASLLGVAVWVLWGRLCAERELRDRECREELARAERHLERQERVIRALTGQEPKGGPGGDPAP